MSDMAPSQNIIDMVSAQREEAATLLRSRDAASVRPDLVEWLERWTSRSYVDDEYIADLGLVLGRAMDWRADADVVAWMADAATPAALEAGGGLLRGFWRTSANASPHALERLASLSLGFPRGSGAYTVGMAALASAATAHRQHLPAPLLESTTATLRNEAKRLEAEGNLAGLYQLLQYV
jgi:hypothetical protein